MWKFASENLGNLGMVLILVMRIGVLVEEVRVERIVVARRGFKVGAICRDDD